MPLSGPIIATSSAEAMLRILSFIGGFLTFIGVWNFIFGFVVRYTASHDEEKMRAARNQMWSSAIWLIFSFAVSGLAFWVKRHYML